MIVEIKETKTGYVILGCIISNQDPKQPFDNLLLFQISRNLRPRNIEITLFDRAETDCALSKISHIPTIYNRRVLWMFSL
jgi:hypothetical protein